LIEQRFESFEARRNWFGERIFGDQRICSLESVAGDADDRGFIALDATLSEQFSATPAVTPPAVSAKIPSVSASCWMAETISGSEMSSAQPPDSRISFMA